MARPRSLPDEALLDAALVIIEASGPDGVTFAAIAHATGLAAATLVQRFGSKPALVKAALLRAWDLLDARTEAFAAETDANAAGAVALLVRLSADYSKGDSHADQLMLLREDFRDADLRERGRQWGQRLRAIIAPRLAAGDGADHDGARELTTLWQGSIIWWGFEREGSAEDYVAALLGGWLARRERREA